MSVFEQLKAPFSPTLISWRVGSTTQDKSKGLAFGYIDARDVMHRLDEVCGPENWQNNYTVAGAAIVCNIGIRVSDNDWVWKADGAGATDVEGEKGMMSDAFKRAAVRFGIGRYLYDIPATWVAIEAAGKSYKIKESEFSRLENILRKGFPELVIASPAQTQDSFVARNEYMVECREAIGQFDDAAKLILWWNDQKEQRRKHQLDAAQVDTLKKAVMDKRDTLEGRKAA